jgi:hypothetical protein
MDIASSLEALHAALDRQRTDAERLERDARDAHPSACVSEAFVEEIRAQIELPRAMHENNHALRA